MMNLTDPPVLMYHGVVTDSHSIPHGRETGADLYDVRLDNFQKQISWLASQGYQTIRCEEVPNPVARQVILTFDDGEQNNFEHVLPVLRQHGFFAYFFVTVKRIGSPGYMHWHALRELVANGMIIGAHGYTHEILTLLDDQHLSRELVDARRVLEENLGMSVDTFSIPRGFYNQRVLDFAQQAGYRHVFVSDKNKCADVCRSRVAVKGKWSLKRFSLALQNKRPVSETIFDAAKICVKRILGDRGYNSLRTSILENNK